MIEHEGPRHGRQCAPERVKRTRAHLDCTHAASQNMRECMQRRTPKPINVTPTPATDVYWLAVRVLIVILDARLTPSLTRRIFHQLRINHEGQGAQTSGVVARTSPFKSGSERLQHLLCVRSWNSWRSTCTWQKNWAHKSKFGGGAASSLLGGRGFPSSTLE